MGYGGGLVLLSVLVSTGCAMNHPTPEQIATASYGQYPDNYQEIIQSYMSSILFDPTSVMYSEWRGPSKGYFQDDGKAVFGYRVCVEVNAKNRMGGYTGWQVQFFMIKDGRVIHSEGAYRYGIAGEEMIFNAYN